MLQDSAPDITLPSMQDDVILLVHPWLAPTFVSVVDPNWSNSRISAHVKREASRVVGEITRDWHVKHEFVGTDLILGDRADRILITCIPPGVLSIGSIVGTQRTDVRCSVAAIASFISSQDTEHEDHTRVTVAIGLYGTWIEVSIHQNGSLRFATFLANHGLDPSNPYMDALTSLVSLASSAGFLKPRIGRVLLYGHGDDDSVVRNGEIFTGATVEWLRPNEIFDAGSRHVTDSSTYAPVAAGVIAGLLSHV